jgi:preprotein translocase subunit YajC
MSDAKKKIVACCLVLALMLAVFVYGVIRPDRQRALEHLRAHPPGTVDRHERSGKP